ncbi:phosphatidylglycerol/phosphatidylinositol transfer protein [Rhodotorula diobovata]|uniref:Phosphatidylglycerol/phosphatidylinositol transfer protein n=1 Tax=Rhodotorula diobovata TaxID=5288 RepID=A0A5C5FZL8_9BASI|nr:phosphatidylglycerol/phosphatidylinositol transfer protein [Rhodotorula diobovata]
MLFRSTLALAALSATALAVPAPGPVDSQLVLNQAGKAALDWSAGRLSRLGEDRQVDAMTQWGWYDCGEPGDALEIESIKVSPDPPKPGHKLTIEAKGKVHNLVDEGTYADVTVKLGLIKLLTKRFDVCDELDNANATLSCPIEPGSYTITQSVDLPAEIPRAKFQVQARVFTQEELPAACMDLWINFLVPDKP